MARRKQEEEHENHERWLVSYADFITLLFAFFVVMYAISQVNEGKYRVLSDALVSAFRSPPSSPTPMIFTNPRAGNASQANTAFKSQQTDATAEAQARKIRSVAGGVQQAMASLIKEGQVKITQSKRGIAIEMNASILFQPAAAELSVQSVSVLSSVARLLANTDNLIQVEGHTDNVPINSLVYPSNWELSAARAGSVVRLFQEQGVAPQRMVAIGYGEYRPVESNDRIESRSRNRRVTVQILADNKDEVAVIEAAKPAP